jgi:toxin-antitoxin system PIN domain toxin
VLLLDANVVLAAYREDLPQHDGVIAWLDELLEEGQPFSVPMTVWASFVRLVTNRRIFDPPATLAEAFAFVDATCAHPHHRSLDPGPRHISLLRRVCTDADATGDLVSDAVLAAIALEHGCAVASLDRDFARFESIDHVIPGRARP